MMSSKTRFLRGAGVLALAALLAFNHLEGEAGVAEPAVVLGPEPTDALGSDEMAAVSDMPVGERVSSPEEEGIRSTSEALAGQRDLELCAQAKRFAEQSDWFLLEPEEYLESPLLNPDGVELTVEQRETLERQLTAANTEWNLLTAQRSQAVRRIVEERHSLGLSDEELWPRIGFSEEMVSSQTMSLNGRTYRFEVRKGDSAEVDAIFASEVEHTTKSNEEIALAILRMLDV